VKHQEFLHFTSFELTKPHNIFTKEAFSHPGGEERGLEVDGCEIREGMRGIYRAKK
jgi:hypothetical protein